VGFVGPSNPFLPLRKPLRSPYETKPGLVIFHFLSTFLFFLSTSGPPLTVYMYGTPLLSLPAILNRVLNLRDKNHIDFNCDVGSCLLAALLTPLRHFSL